MAKKKIKKNIMGLLNQSQRTSHVKEAADDETEAVETPSTHLAMQVYLGDDDTNPYPEFHRKAQKMMTERGEQKGLQQTLEE